MVVDLHPDELMWRAARGLLTGAERADLAAHLGRCPACALESAVRTEAAAALAPSDADHGLTVRLVDQALSDRRPRGVSLRRTTRGWPRAAARAALVLGMLASAAVGAAAVVVRLHARQAAAPEAADSEPTPPAARARRAPPRARVEPPAPGAVLPESLPDPVPSAASPPEEPMPSPRVISAAPPAASRAQPVPPGDTRPTAPEGATSASAAALLARAELARAARRFREASGLYDELVRRFPSARESIVAGVLDGQLMLDERRDPARALARFEHYLATDPTGTLAEEARLGRARSLADLDRRDDERAAWLDLLARHPRSVHASLARARLAALAHP